jgi:CO dehydrogenase maturation factor
MGLKLALTGKGGVGKTTLAALAIDWLVSRGASPVLAVDADSNANLHEALGVAYSETVGGIRESARSEVPRLQGMAKQEFLDLRVQAALVEQAGYDLIVMGRPEGQGCYCFANNALREVLDRLSRQYGHIVLDSEAGLEHISRRTLLQLTHLLIVSDASVRGVRTARRISDLADEVKLGAEVRGLILNRVPEGGLTAALEREVEATGLPLLATIPFDPAIAAMDAGGMNVTAIPPQAPARGALYGLLERLLADPREMGGGRWRTAQTVHP